MNKEGATVIEVPSHGPNGGNIRIEIIGNYVHVSGTANVCVSVPASPEKDRFLLDTYDPKGVRTLGCVSVEVMANHRDELEIRLGNSVEGDNTNPSFEQPRLLITKNVKDGTCYDIHALHGPKQEPKGKPWASKRPILRPKPKLQKTA